MRVRLLMVVVALAVVAAPIAANAQSGFKVTGGGQIITDSDFQGAGDTIAFTAQDLDGDTTTPAAKGQVQFVPRGQTDTAGDAKFHGEVTCLITATGPDDEAVARFGGFLRHGNQLAAQAFTIDAVDNGEGANSAGDTILVRLTDEPCADNPENDDEDEAPLVSLARGNVQVHNYPESEEEGAALLLGF